MEFCDKDYPILDTDPQKGNHSYSGRDPEIHSGNVQGNDSSDQCKWYISQYKERVFHISKQDKQQEEDHQDTHRHYLRQPV